MRLNKYFSAFKISWQETLEYRANTIFRLLMVLVGLVGIYFLWSSIFEDKAVINGYTKEQIVTYYVIVGYLFGSIYASIPVAKDIQDGSLSIYLTKPISYLSYIYWQSLARRVLRLLLGLPIVLLIFYLFQDNLYIVTDPKAYLILILTSLFAINILFLFDLLLSFLEFKIFFSDSITMITNTIAGFFAGTLIPIVFLPPFIQQIGNFLPFQYTGYFLIDAFLGRVTLQELFIGIGLQLIWTLVLLLLVKLAWKAGLKHYEAVGA
ncbi:MAG: ABC-2 family transporter protein [Candidatus Uhrbacteria bacterium]